MQLSDFDFHLPEHQIAQQALTDRAASRMLVVYRKEGRWEDRSFREFPTFLHPRDWQALVRPGRKMPMGQRVRFSEDLEAEVVARGEFGERTVRFHGNSDLWAAFERIGHVPLPPYIKRNDEAADRERYQTVFAREKGSVAAPTAGLHFTGEVLDECRRAGADIA